jgi:hypothetical protein
MPPGWGPTAGNNALDSFFATYKFMQLHTGQPGANGTSNVAGNTVRVDLTGLMNAAAAGHIDNSADINWTTVSTSETYTFCSFWTLGAGGVFGGSGTVVANPISSGDDFRIPAGQLDGSVTLAS